MTGNIIIGSEDLGTSDPWDALLTVRAQRDDLRDLAAEILATPEVAIYAPPVSLAEWRKRAGLEPMP